MAETTSQVEQLEEDPIIVGTNQTGILETTIKLNAKCVEPLGTLHLYYWHIYDQDFDAPQTSFNNNMSSMSAMLATACSSFDSSWYPDSRETNHLTLDENNLITKRITQAVNRFI